MNVLAMKCINFQMQLQIVLKFINALEWMKFRVITKYNV